MLRISKLTDYGTVVLACLATAGLVTSVRGAYGGYQLARPATRISAAAIIDAIEGPVAITECSGSHSTCDIEGVCRTGSAWQRINGSIRRALDDISLAQLAGLEALAQWRPEMPSLRPAGAARSVGRV